jgi:hypothetical protein
MAETLPDRIYRRAWYGNHPKSIALRRESDYHTGLSFTTLPPSEGPYFVYSVEKLEREGFAIALNGEMAVVSMWDTGWALRDQVGNIRQYSQDHVSVYHDHDRWLVWYQAELAINGNGSSSESERFCDLAEEYKEG